MHVIVQIPAKIQQDKKAIGSRTLDVGQDFLRLHHGLRRLIRGIESNHSLGDRPAKRSQLELTSELAQSLDDLGRLVALDRNEGCTRADDRDEIMEGAFGADRSELCRVWTPKA